MSDGRPNILSSASALGQGVPLGSALDSAHPTPLSSTPSASPSAPSPRIWALASGKGGVGKSLLAANLGCLLAESDWPTLLIDLDLQGANLHTFLGVGAEVGGIGPFLAGAAPLDAQIRHHEVPGLSYALGCGAASVPATALDARGIDALDDALRRSGAREILLDLPTGMAPFALDLFNRADVPILVVTPDPAAIENAHRFLRRAWLRRLQTLLGPTGGDLLEAGLEDLGVDCAPPRLLSWLRARGEALPGGEGASVGHIWGVTPHLVVNQVQSSSDVEIGFGVVRAVEGYFGVQMRYLGAIPQDPGVRLATQRRRLRLRELSEERLSRGLAQVADHVVEGGALTPGDPASFALS